MAAPVLCRQVACRLCVTAPYGASSSSTCCRVPSLRGFTEGPTAADYSVHRIAVQSRSRLSSILPALWAVTSIVGSLSKAVVAEHQPTSIRSQPSSKHTVNVHLRPQSDAVQHASNAGMCPAWNPGSALSGAQGESRVPCRSFSGSIAAAFSGDSPSTESIEAPQLVNADALVEILNFWFGSSDVSGAHPPKQKIRAWFTKDPNFDKLCKHKFEALIAKAVAGGLESWEHQPSSSLALVILLDQFSRNIYRDQPASFSQDAQALRVAKSCLARGFDQQVGFLERSFFYMPLEHSEDLEDQERACQLFHDLELAAPVEIAEVCQSFHSYAKKHRIVIERFGRFPHRNKILRRESTVEELEFLTQAGSRF